MLPARDGNERNAAWLRPASRRCRRPVSARNWKDAVVLLSVLSLASLTIPYLPAPHCRYEFQCSLTGPIRTRIAVWLAHFNIVKCLRPKSEGNGNRYSTNRTSLGNNNIKLLLFSIADTWISKGKLISPFHNERFKKLYCLFFLLNNILLTYRSRK